MFKWIIELEKDGNVCGVHAVWGYLGSVEKIDNEDFYKEDDNGVMPYILYIPPLDYS